MVHIKNIYFFKKERCKKKKPKNMHSTEQRTSPSELLSSIGLNTGIIKSGQYPPPPQAVHSLGEEKVN